MEIMGIKSFSLCACVSVVAFLVHDLGLSAHTCNAMDDHTKSAASFSGHIHNTSILAVRAYQGIDNHKCPPSSCGNIHNISYPFRLQQDPKYCGRPRYTLNCDNNVTILRLDSRKYYVKAIYYYNSTIRVVDPGLEKNNCASLPSFPLANSNFSVGPVGDTYWPSSSSKPVTFLKCENPVNSSLYVDTAPCIKHKLAYGYVKLGTTNASDLEDGCSIYWTAMITSFDGKERNISYRDIHNELVYGFELQYGATYVVINCHGQWRLDDYTCFPHSIPGIYIVGL